MSLPSCNARGAANATADGASPISTQNAVDDPPQTDALKTLLEEIEGKLHELEPYIGSCAFDGENSVVPHHEEARLKALSRLIDRQMAMLGKYKAEVDHTISAWEVILRRPVDEAPRFQHMGSVAVSDSDDGQTSARPNSPHGGELADAVVEFLRATGQALHFREIYDRMSPQGLINIGGVDPASNLLARYSSDTRLERVSRGRYRAKASLNVNPADTR